MSDFLDKEKPINNGKDVGKIETHEINTMGGKVLSMKMGNKTSGFTCFEPKRINRWYLKFSGSFEGVPSWSVKKTSRPTLKNGSWSNIKITFHDAIGTSTSQALVEGFRDSWQNRNRSSEIPIIEYKLLMLDPTGVTIEEWIIKGKVINADFGKLNYKKSKLAKIKMIIEPISVILNY